MSTWAPGQRVWVNRHTRIVHDAPEYDAIKAGRYDPERYVLDADLPEWLRQR